MDLSQLRQQIDTIDRQIVDLYEKRMDVSRQVAEYKIETGKKVFDKQREQEKIAGVKALTHNDFNSHGVEELFEQIMSMSRKLQYQLLAAHGSEGRLPSSVWMNWRPSVPEWSIRGRKAPIPRQPCVNFWGECQCVPCGILPGCHERHR